MSVSSVLQAAVLVLLLPQAVMTASPMETIAYSGGKVTLSCRVENYDVIPPLSWEKPDGSVLTFASKESRFEVDESTGTLTISGMTTADSGLYLCHKNLNAADQKTVDGTQSAATSLEIRATIRHLIKIIDLPRFLTPPSANRTVKTGSSEIFPCKATDEKGHPVDVFWTKVGAPLDPKSSKRNPDGSLSLKNITKEMAGVYVCSALLLNEEGGDDDTKMEKQKKTEKEQNHNSVMLLPGPVRTKSESTMKLTVKDSDIFTVEPTTQEVVAGQDVFFHCFAAAPVIYWELHHQDGHLEPLFPVQENHDQRMGVFPNNTLYIRGVQPEKDPLGVTCVAEAERSHAKLIIKDHFGCKVPRFIQTPNAVMAPQGSTILLTCSVHNLDVNANVAWYFKPKQGTSTSFKLLEPSIRHIIFPSGDLQILSTRNEDEDSDSGEYECVVMCNNTIQDLVTARVEITDHPSLNTQVASVVDTLEQDAPYLVRINSSEAEFSWNDPSAEMCGLLEYFCDDSSMSVWNRSLPCRMHPGRNVRISGLKSGKRCFAAVRSQNIKTGFTTKLSPIISFTVTYNMTSPDEIGEDQIKATLRGELVSFSKIRLLWDVNPAFKYMGFNIKCQCTVNNSLHELELKTTDGSWRSAVVENLNSSLTYECYVLVITSPGKHSVTNAVSITTSEVPPPPAPSNLTADHNGHGFMLVRWTKPDTSALDPQITGYQVWCYNGEQLIQRKVLKLGPNVTEVLLPLQLEYPQLRIEVAALAGKVVGLHSKPVQIKFQSGAKGDAKPIGGIFREMWVLILAGVVVWLLLFIICVIIIKRYISEKMSTSGAANPQYCSLEPCRPLPGMYGNRFDEDKRHNWGHSGEMHSITPFSGYPCVTVSNNLESAVMNHDLILQNGTLMRTKPINNLEDNNLLRVKPVENYPETRSAPNLVSDIGSDESYEEIPVGETSPRGIFQGDHAGHVPSHYGPSGPHYVVYDTGDYAQPPTTHQQRPMEYHFEIGKDNIHAVQASQNQSNHSTLSAPANSRTSTITPSHAILLRPKMGSNALMLRTTSIHSCMGNKISSTQANSQPVTILPRNSTIMPLVGVASSQQQIQPIANQGDFPTSPQYTNSSIEEADETKPINSNLVPPELPAHHPSRPFYQKPAVESVPGKRSSPQFIAESFSPTYEELPSIINGSSARSSSSQASSPPLSSLCRKHSLKNKSRNIENSAC